MSTTRSPFSKYCLIRHNEELRRLINLRIEQNSAMPYSIAARAGIKDGHDLELWRTGKNLKAITQWQLVNVARQLGIFIEIKFKLDEPVVPLRRRIKK